jgi:uncharacterized protein (DUF1330 family)
MKKPFGMGLVLLGGIAVGATITGLHAQSKAPSAYAVIDISEVTDPETFKKVISTAAPAVASFGHFIVRTENIVATDGTPPKRFVIIAFDDMAKAKAWDASAAQKEVTALRVKSTKSRQFFVEALANP